MDNKKLCFNDTDCSAGNICAFDKTDLNHYCIKSEKSELYQGCIINDKDLNKVETNGVNSIANCINFSRRQINNDGFNNNYFIYKPKKRTSVDTTTINIYLKCGKEILAVLPYDDYFELKCSDNLEECRLVSKENLFNFIKQNIKNTPCRDFNDIYLEYDYLCDNEGVRLSQKVKVKENQKVVINITCPVNKENEKYKTKCASLFIDESNLKNNVDKDVPLQKCSTPLYKTPFIVKDKTKYEEAIKEKAHREMQMVQNEIDNKMEEVSKLKIEKYMRENNVTRQEAEEALSKKKPEWITLENTDAVSFFLNSPTYGEMIQIYDMPVMSIEEARQIAVKNNEFYFVWFHNTYNNSEYASKLFFIHPNKNDNPKFNIFDKKILKRDANVTTCVFNSEIEGYDNVFDSITDLQLYTFDQVIDLISQTVAQTSNINGNTDVIIDNIESKSEINSQIINKINNKITTLEQRVKMTDYESNVNDGILNIIYIILFFIVVLAIGTFVYMVQTYPNVKLIGR